MAQEPGQGTHVEELIYTQRQVQISWWIVNRAEDRKRQKTQQYEFAMEEKADLMGRGQLGKRDWQAVVGKPQECMFLF